MADDIMVKIQDAIRSTLPTQIGEELQKVLKEAEENKKALYYEKHEHNGTKQKLQELERRVVSQTEIEKRVQSVIDRETKVTLREHAAELNEYKVTAATQRVADLKEVTLAVFANSKFKYERSSSGNAPVATNPGQGVSSGYTSEQITETREG